MGGSPAGEWPDGGSTSPGKRNALGVFEICRQRRNTDSNRPNNLLPVRFPPRPAIANGSQLKPAGLAQSNDTHHPEQHLSKPPYFRRNAQDTYQEPDSNQN
uniref:Uncharacterized protein n=1 Tax=Coccidioides posadasii RMSCC 3488 TaxID=454284 RepID=A0A0J6F950_COCPO|nr:hypothetical protein CPAG_01840 [Coccidioides posadasii RMSCC 3488]